MRTAESWALQSINNRSLYSLDQLEAFIKSIQQDALHEAARICEAIDMKMCDNTAAYCAEQIKEKANRI